MLEKIEDLSVVRLKDGREGTVVSVYDYPDMPLAYLVEVDETQDGLVTVRHEGVDAVLWKPER